MNLRNWQVQCLEAIREKIGSGLTEMTIQAVGGAGKTVVIATIAAAAAAKGLRSLVLVHSAVIAEQNAATCALVTDNGEDVGTYCASVRQLCHSKMITSATVQSYVKISQSTDKADYLFIDESHYVNPRDESLYRRVLETERVKNPQLIVIKFSATPWLEDVGEDENIIFRYGYSEALIDGAVCQLTLPTVALATTAPDLEGVRLTSDREGGGGEAATRFEKLAPIHAREIVELGGSRRKIIVFCQSKRHAHTVYNEMLTHICNSEIVLSVSGERGAKERIARFKDDGECKYLINVLIGIAGLDIPQVDCVVFLRAFSSVRAWAQANYRGARVSDGKADCWIVDYGGNIKRNGWITELKSPEAKTKKCKCGHLVRIIATTCRKCGYRFLEEEEKQKPREEKEEGEEGARKVLDTQKLMVSYYSGRHTGEGVLEVIATDCAVRRSRKGEEMLCVEYTLARGIDGIKKITDYILPFSRNEFAAKKGREKISSLLGNNWWRGRNIDMETLRILVSRCIVVSIRAEKNSGGFYNVSYAEVMRWE